MDRFTILEEDDNFEPYSVLLDNKTGKIVFRDRMEPEDATLSRDLSPLVALLNELAADANH